MKRYLSGIQPSGALHLGNYYGAIKQHIELKEQGQSFYFIADYHALTSLKDAEALKSYTRQVAATYVALGLLEGNFPIDREPLLFRQSDVPEVHELAWFLSCVLGVGVLERCHAYKDKVKRGLSANTGLFTYPVLMAADILIYGSTHVPVGQDQKQHVEVARDLAKAFNSAFGAGEQVLKQPELVLSPSAWVPGTDGQKMSKTYGNTIPIFGSKKQIKKSVNSIVTDSKNPGEEPLDPDTCNAFAIYALLASQENTEALRNIYLHDRSFMGYGVVKQLIMEEHEKTFGSEVLQRYKNLLEMGSELDEILQAGAFYARAEARKTLDRCREAVGIGPMAATASPGIRPFSEIKKLREKTGMSLKDLANRDG